MYTNEQKKLVSHIRVKVKNLFAQYPVKAHNFDHAERVSRWAVRIAKSEKANMFLAELAGLLHDIGRVPEHQPGNTKTHYELSYEMCQGWFREDREFGILTKTEKTQILYALRYHYNDAADDYVIAWILRDADKLDGFGRIGLQRSIDYFEGDMNKIILDLRLRYHTLYNIRSCVAKKIIQEKKMFEPIERYYRKQLQDRIESVVL